MPTEIKTSKHKVETELSATLKKKFKSHCKKLNLSQAQRLRDLIQEALKK